MKTLTFRIGKSGFRGATIFAKMKENTHTLFNQEGGGSPMGRKERKNKSKTSAFPSHRFMLEPPCHWCMSVYTQIHVCVKVSRRQSQRGGVSSGSPASAQRRRTHLAPPPVGVSGGWLSRTNSQRRRQRRTR